MKFFLDENFPRPALNQLQSAGHTAVHRGWKSLHPARRTTSYSPCPKERAIFISTTRIFSTPSRWLLPDITARLSLLCAGPNRDELLRRLAAALAALGERKLDDSVWLVTDTAHLQPP